MIRPAHSTHQTCISGCLFRGGTAAWTATQEDR